MLCNSIKLWLWSLWGLAALQGLQELSENTADWARSPCGPFAIQYCKHVYDDWIFLMIIFHQSTIDIFCSASSCDYLFLANVWLWIMIIIMMIFMRQRPGSLSSLCGDGLGLLDHPFLLQYDTKQYPPSELVIIILQYDTSQYPPSELVLCWCWSRYQAIPYKWPCHHYPSNSIYQAISSKWTCHHYPPIWYQAISSATHAIAMHIFHHVSQHQCTAVVARVKKPPWPLAALANYPWQMSKLTKHKKKITM